LICVLTHPRQGASYLVDTLASIDLSANGPRYVVTDSDAALPSIPGHWGVLSFQRRATERPENRWAMWRSFLLAYELGDDLIVCEDDIALCRNGAAHAEALSVPDDVAWVSLYDPHFRSSAPRGLHRMAARQFSFAQMLKFPLRTCALMRAMGCETVDRLGSDDQLAALGAMLSLTYALHVPSLAQHVGEVSAVGNGDLSLRTSQSFRAEYDPTAEDHRTFQ
jgi:hypothetical protein